MPRAFDKGRLADLLLLVSACVSSIVAVLLIAGRVWFRSLVTLAFGAWTLPLAAAFAAAAFAAGAAFVTRPPSRGSR